MDTNTNPAGPPRFWEGQVLHGVCLAILLLGAALGWLALGRPAPVAFWAAVAAPVVHQIYVWIAWRLELHGKRTSAAIGFDGYVVAFFILFGARFVTLAWLGFVDRGSLSLPAGIQVVLTLILLTLGGYAMYSVRRYFGMARAAGADHFDPRYREMPLVKEGIFRFTNNGMYVYAFMLFWAIAIGFNSSAALLVAAFSHAYIWVHFLATEKPDMNFLYRTSEIT